MEFSFSTMDLKEVPMKRRFCGFWISGEANMEISTLLNIEGLSKVEAEKVISQTENQKRIAELILELSKAESSEHKLVLSAEQAVYPVTVGNDQTFDQLVTSGDYHWVSDMVDAYAFADNRNYVGPRGDFKLRLIGFHRRISTQEAIDEIIRRGFWPAYTGQILAFGARYPDIQNIVAVVALNANWSFYVLCLNRSQGRHLNVERWDTEWERHAHFLVYDLEEQSVTQS